MLDTSLTEADKNPAVRPTEAEKPPIKQMAWHEAIDVIKPHVVRILTPRGSGTGFLVARSKGLSGIATAAHVVDESHHWEEPIRIYHTYTDKSVLLREAIAQSFWTKSATPRP